MSADDGNEKGEYIAANANITLRDLEKHGIHRSSTKGKKVAQNVAIGTSIVGGTAAATVGVIAAGTSATGAISAAGAAIGGVAGGVVGSGVGLAVASRMILSTEGGYPYSWPARW